MWNCRNRRRRCAAARRPPPRRRPCATCWPIADRTTRAVRRTSCAALGHRRLSIVDLASGQQPLANEDGSIWISFNGEIYNHARSPAPARALRSRLSHAVRYRERSSTPTSSGVTTASITCAACSRSRSGMRRRRRLLLARDRLGVKPLYWARCGDRLIFASEIKAILASGLVIRARPTRPRFPNCSARVRSPAPTRCSPASTSSSPGTC